MGYQYHPDDMHTVKHLGAAVAMLRDRTSEIANLHYPRDTE